MLFVTFDGAMADDAVLPKLPEPGAVVDRKYEIVDVIGRGGMGVVFEATHLKIQQRVALKMLHPSLKGEPGVLERFEREARAAGQLRSPFIARILDVETSGDLPYIVMELLEGRDLEEELTTRKRLPISDAVDYVLQACSAVSHAHSLGIIHRDLKPANLYLCETPEGVPTIKLLDFGISKITREIEANGRDGRLTAAMTTLGSPIYMSPEQLRGAADVDHQADIWGLGVILYELLAGRPPFTGTVTSVTAAIVSDAPPRLITQRPDVPAELEKVVTHALQKMPEHRCENASDFADALVPFASADVVRRVRATFSIPPSPPSSRRGVSVKGRPTPQEVRRAREIETVVAPRAAASDASTSTSTSTSTPTPGSETRHSFASIPPTRQASRTQLMMGLAALTLVIVLGIVGVSQLTKSETTPPSTTTNANIGTPSASSVSEPDKSASSAASAATSTTTATSATTVMSTPTVEPRSTTRVTTTRNPPPPPRPASPSPVRGGDPKNPIHL